MEEFHSRKRCPLSASPRRCRMISGPDRPSRESVEPHPPDDDEPIVLTTDATPLPLAEADSKASFPALDQETADTAPLPIAQDDPQTGERSAAAPALPAFDLIPVRMLNEFTYCPRLGYLEWVQGEWAENLETLEGTFGHRNVDKPDRKQIAPPAPVSTAAASSENAIATMDEADAPSHGSASDSIHARSIMLSAESEGLLAKLDLLELTGRTATPVDYKRGTLPDIPEGAYEPERVQLCAQGLILRENGFESTEGVLYYIGSRRRVTIPFTDELITRTRELATQFRRIAAEGRIPPPLDDSPKCPRCSLVGICLPDEVNLLRQLNIQHAVAPLGCEITEEEPPTTPRARRLLAPRTEALPLYLQEQQLTLTKSGERLVIKKKSEEIRSVRLKDVSQVCVYGSVHLTEPAMREVVTHGIPICHFSYGGWYYATTTGLTHKNVELRIRQFQAAADDRSALALAKQFVIGKIRNCRTMLRRNLNVPHKDRILFQLNDYAGKASRAISRESLLGIEGMAAKVYFSGFKDLLNGGETFDFNDRNRRPPKDPVNALLSFVYSLLTKDLTITLQAVGFDPMLGMYHQPRYGKPSLALDLAEEFRPLVADSTVLTLINGREVNDRDFLQKAGAVAMTDAARRAVIAAYERRMQTEITHPIFGYRLTYRRVLEVQARLLARTLLGEIPEYPSFQTR